VFVTHFLDQVYDVSTRITVLRNGRLVGSYPTAELPRLELIGRMMGRDPAEVKAMQAPHPQRAETAAAAKYLVARDVGRRGSIEPFTLGISRGEVVGLAGLLGSGRTEMLRLLFGIEPRDSGEIVIGGAAARLRTPRQAIDAGMGFTPEDRKVAGIIPDLSVRENIILVLQARRGWLRKLSRAEQDRLADQYIRALNIATSDAEKPIKYLSGGNQQKAILGRWLASRPQLLLLDEPTRGIDVGAKFEIAKLMETLRQEGMAIVFVSSELDEVVRSSQRVVVLRDRRKIAELTGGQIDEHTIMNTIAEGGRGDAVAATDTGVEAELV
jgi:monosaccharide-transporting ATPase